MRRRIRMTPIKRVKQQLELETAAGKRAAAHISQLTDEIVARDAKIDTLQKTILELRSGRDSYNKRIAVLKRVTLDKELQLSHLTGYVARLRDTEVAAQGPTVCGSSTETNTREHIQRPAVMPSVMNIVHPVTTVDFSEVAAVDRADARMGTVREGPKPHWLDL